MAMTMNGEIHLPASKEVVWLKLNDPEVLKICIPGCEELEKTLDNEFRATTKMKVGPVSARFKGRVILSDFDPPNSYKITGEGEGGMAGCKVLLPDRFMGDAKSIVELAETRYGLVPGFAIQRLAAMVGVAAASNLLFSRQFTPAPAAQALGLTEIVVGAKDLSEAVRSVTENLAHLDPAAVSMAKQALRAHRRHAANLDHSAWANAAMFVRSSTTEASQGFYKRSRRPTVQERSLGPADGRKNRDVI